MGMIEDVMKALDRWEVWRDVQTLPAKQIDLEKRVKELEEKLGGKWPGDLCHKCGERALRLWHSYPQVDKKGNITEDWKCERCGNQEPRFFRPSAR